MNSKEPSNTNQNYIKCQNCHQEILSSKMFLHEGFCLRNNIYCSKCNKVILKTDYENHVKIVHCNPQKSKKLLKNQEIIEKTEDNIQKSPENLKNRQNPENKPPILINQINYNSCVNMDFRSIKKLEIIKYNKPIVITTHDNPLQTPEEYKEFFLKNYMMAKSLNTNEIDISKIENSEANSFREKNIKNLDKQIPTDSKYPNSNKNKKFQKFQYEQNLSKNCNSFNFQKTDIIKIPEKDNKNEVDLRSNFIFGNDNLKHTKNIENIERPADNITSLYDSNIKNKFIQNSQKNYQPSKNIKSQKEILKNYNTQNYKKTNKNICYTPDTFNSKRIIKDTKAYKLNDYIIRKTKNKIPKVENQSNVNEKKNTYNKEPLDRASRKITNNNSNVYYTLDDNLKNYEPQKKSKYQKCEYCGRAVEDIIAHNYRCQSRRMIEIIRIQSKQEDEKKVREKKNSKDKETNFNLIAAQSAQNWCNINKINSNSLIPKIPHNFEQKNKFEINTEPRFKKEFNVSKNNMHSSNISNNFNDKVLFDNSTNNNNSCEKKDDFTEMKAKKIIAIPKDSQINFRDSKTPLRYGDNEVVNLKYSI